jgi:hypothetical protein
MFYKADDAKKVASEVKHSRDCTVCAKGARYGLTYR